MNKILLLITFTLASILISAQVIDPEVSTIDVQFEQTSIAFGQIEKGEKLETQFIFTNTGTDTLEIDLVSGCDCTTLDWTYGNIAPGEQGVVDVLFDSKEKEESGEVEIDIIFKNIDPRFDAPYFKIVNYTFEFKEN